MPHSPLTRVLLLPLPLLVLLPCLPGLGAAGRRGQEVSLPKDLVLTASDIPEEVGGELRRINETLAGRTKPEQNAAVLIVHLLGESAFVPDLADASLEMLGIETMSTTVPEIVAVEPYVEDQRDIAPADRRRTGAPAAGPDLRRVGTSLEERRISPRRGVPEGERRGPGRAGRGLPPPRLLLPDALRGFAAEADVRLLSGSGGSRSWCGSSAPGPFSGPRPGTFPPRPAISSRAIGWRTCWPADLLRRVGRQALTMDAFACRAASTLLSGGMLSPEQAAEYGQALDAMPRLAALRCGGRHRRAGDPAAGAGDPPLRRRPAQGVLRDPRREGPQAPREGQPLGPQVGSARKRADELQDNIVKARPDPRPQGAVRALQADGCRLQALGRDAGQPPQGDRRNDRQGPRRCEPLGGRDDGDVAPALYWQRRATDDRAERARSPADRPGPRRLPGRPQGVSGGPRSRSLPSTSRRFRSTLRSTVRFSTKSSRRITS